MCGLMLTLLLGFGKRRAELAAVAADLDARSSPNILPHCSIVSLPYASAER
jgi:hypothetical protein